MWNVEAVNRVGGVGGFDGAAGSGLDFHDRVDSDAITDGWISQVFKDVPREPCTAKRLSVRWVHVRLR